MSRGLKLSFTVEACIPFPWSFGAGGGTVLGLILVLLTLRASAAVRYVNVNNGSPAAPFTSWATAATTIQAAVDVANAGDLVLVTDGVYQLGGQAVNGQTTNRVAITKAVSVRSVNGPLVTVIRGEVTGATVRCAYLTNNAVLAGFTLTNGAAHSFDSEPASPDLEGGGVWCEAESAVVSNCVVRGCSAPDSGGGAFGGTLKNCLVNDNSAGNVGGGACFSTLINCTLTDNTAFIGGGAENCSLRNSILFYNRSFISDANYSTSTLDYCCATPLPNGGAGNTQAEPQLTDPGHVSAESPCRAAGSAAYASGTDLDGQAWLNPPSMGCDEYYGGSSLGALSVVISSDYTNAAVGFGLNFAVAVTGHASASRWDFGDGSVVSNRLEVSHGWATPGDYVVAFRAYNDSNPGGISATVTVQVVSQPVHYVSRSNATPVAPYASWATAATNIQDAVDAATAAGALVLVTNGTYDTGGQAVSGASNRVAITKALIVQSVNGPAATVVDGGGLMSCVYLASGGTLAGLTLTNGAGDYAGGVRCQTSSGVVSNCVLVGNGGGGYLGTFINCALTANNGGGVYGATLVGSLLGGNNGGGATLCHLTNCVLTTNSAFFGAGAAISTLEGCWLVSNVGIGGGGANGSTLINCTMVSNSAAWYGGGGARESTLINCTLIGNWADYGGGAEGGTLSHCALTKNWSVFTGGGASDGYLTNCVLTDNWAYESGGGVSASTVYGSALSANSATNQGGGAYSSTLLHCTMVGNYAPSGGGVASGAATNCILYYNRSLGIDANYAGDALSYCCVQPLPLNGPGNFTNSPLLADVAHISPSSPCRAAGTVAGTFGSDLDGEAWLNPPSIGCDEYYAGVITGALSVAIEADYTSIAAGYAVNFTSRVTGHASASRWDFGDGTIVSNQPYASHGWALAGDYVVTFQAYNDTFLTGVSASITIHVVTQPVHFVSRSNSAPVSPYLSWATAATNIQDGVNAVSVVGALVLVTNGVYDAGGAAWNGESNRVVLATPATIESVNGPAVTVINGGGLARGVYLTNGAALLGFSLTNGTAGNGGAVCCESSSAVVSNCLFAGNAVGGSGGGVYRGTLTDCAFAGNSANSGGGASFCYLNSCTFSTNTAYSGGGARDSILVGCTLNGNSSGDGGGATGGSLYNCQLAGNWAGVGGGANGATIINSTLKGNWTSDIGGGANASTLYNCALSGNTATNSGGGANGSWLNNCTLVDNSTLGSGGGAFASTLLNCILFYNTARSGNNFLAATQSFCCTTPLPSGLGNISVEPQLVDLAHIGSTSPCRGAGSTAFASGTDLDGEPWANPPSIGCDEYFSGSTTGTLSVAIQAGYTNLAAGYLLKLTAQISGHASATRWDFGDGTVVSNLLHATHAWTAGGNYGVVLRAYNETYPLGVSAAFTVHVVEAAVHFVSLASTNPVAPFFSWATAATNLQQAADAAYAGSTVLVTNGVYQIGGRVVIGVLTNRLVVTSPITVRSVNGPEVTLIHGIATIGAGAVRCAYLDGDVTLSGFTIANGGTRDVGDGSSQQSGGGVWCPALGPVITNCVFTNNFANNEGGGVYGATLVNCALRGNTSGYNGGGASASALDSCILSSNFAGNAGGGTSGGFITNSTFTANFAATGGAVYNSAVVASHIVGNWTTSEGGAAYGGTFDRCELRGNFAGGVGGAAIYSTFNNSALVGNSSSNAAGAVYDCSVTNCTLAGNRAVSSGGGAQASRLYNSILYYNYSSEDPNYRDSTLAYCCTTPLPSSGAGNIQSEPLLTDFSHLSSGSPCRGTGSAVFVTGQDIDGEAWANPPAIGCDEFYVGSITGALSVAASASFTNVAMGFTVSFQSQITGHASANRWDFGDGTIESNRLYATHSWLAPGSFIVQFSVFNDANPAGVSTSLVVQVENPLHYVAANNPTPIPPFASWATAANQIQDAANAAYAGGTVLVSNGVYQPLAVTKPLSVQSVNGPGVTAINGGGLRCAYLVSGVTLAGFSLSGGASVPSGAGAFCEAKDSLISNCVFTANSSTGQGGGVSGGTINNCLFADNISVSGGGAYLATLNHCTLAGNSSQGDNGGGAHSCTLNFCTITGNSAYGGGGAYVSTLNNCIVSSNSAAYGGGAYQSVLYNCLLVGNTANPSGGAANISTLVNCTITGNSANFGGGVFQCDLYNSIIYFNNAAIGPDVYLSGLTTCWNADPNFLNAGEGNFRLQTNSPCLDAGNNAFVSGTADLDGNRRIMGGTVDIGAYEYVPTEFAAFNLWLQEYGLPVDGSADNLDSDGDGMNNWQEWIAGTVPTNAASALRLLRPARGSSGLVVTWESVSNRIYFLERGINLADNPAFLTLATNLTGQPGTTSYNDRSAIGSGPFLYRVGVQTGSNQFHFARSIIPFTWLQQYGLATDGSADFTDPDGDGANNWMEWKAWTNPTDARSALRMLSPQARTNGMLVSWESVFGQLYQVERATNPGAQFSLLATNITGQATNTSYLDTNASRASPSFYRVGVQP